MEERIIQVGNFLIERPDEIPAPLQLRKIAATAMAIVGNNQGFKSLPRTTRIEPVRMWSDIDVRREGEDATEYSVVSGRFARRPARIAVHPHNGHEYIEEYGPWTMCYRQLEQFTDMDGSWSTGTLSEYRFEWESDRVLRSEVRVAEIPSVDAEEIAAASQVADELVTAGLINDAIDHLDTMSTRPSASGRYFVTKYDAERLLREFRRRNRGEDGIVAEAA